MKTRTSFFPRRLGSLHRGAAFLVGMALLLALAAGAMADLPGGLFRPVDDSQFRDRPARLIPIRGSTFMTGNLSDLVAIAVVFEGQTLRVESSNLQVEPPRSGTITSFLQSEANPQGFQLFEVRNLAGETLGYLLANDEWIEFGFVEPNGKVFLSGIEPVNP